MGVTVRPAQPGELTDWFATYWSGETVVVHGSSYGIDDVEALVAVDDGAIVGALSSSAG